MRTNNYVDQRKEIESLSSRVITFSSFYLSVSFYSSNERKKLKTAANLRCAIMHIGPRRHLPWKY